MGTTRQPGPLLCAEESSAFSYLTPKPLGLNDSVGPQCFAGEANTPGSTGLNVSPFEPVPETLQSELQ